MASNPPLDHENGDLDQPDDTGADPADGSTDAPEESDDELSDDEHDSDHDGAPGDGTV